MYICNKSQFCSLAAGIKVDNLIGLAIYNKTGAFFLAWYIWYVFIDRYQCYQSMLRNHTCPYTNRSVWSNSHLGKFGISAVCTSAFVSVLVCGSSTFLFSIIRGLLLWLSVLNQALFDMTCGSMITYFWERDWSEKSQNLHDILLRRCQSRPRSENNHSFIRRHPGWNTRLASHVLMDKVFIREAGDYQASPDCWWY